MNKKVGKYGKSNAIFESRLFIKKFWTNLIGLFEVFVTVSCCRVIAKCAMNRASCLFVHSS